MTSPVQRPSICYRNLSGYKYQLVQDYQVSVSVAPVTRILLDYLMLTSTSILSINAGYAWDGPSGPTIDTHNFLRGSMVHDALYQLMRLGELDDRVWRESADRDLWRICREDGMSRVRAWYVYRSVRLFAGGSAKPDSRPEVKVSYAP